MKQEITIEVPNDWSAITLRKYLELSADLKAYEGEAEATQAALFYHLCGLTPELMLKLDTETFIKIKNKLNSFVQEIELPLVRTFFRNGVEYGFYPNLSKIEYGAYIDIAKLNSVTINEDWAKIMAILYRPVTKEIGKLYEIAPYSGKEPTEHWRDVNMDVHFGCLFFFIHLSKVLLRNTLKSLSQREEIPANIKSILQKSGDLTNRLSRSQEENS